MKTEQEKQLDRIKALLERGSITEQQYYQKRREIYGLSPATPTLKAPSKLKWWHVMLVILVFGYFIGQFQKPFEQPSKIASSTSLFDNPDELVREMSFVGVGEFNSYNCGNSGQCEAYHGARTWQNHPYGMISMEIKGISSHVDSIRVVLEVDKGADLQKVLSAYDQVLVKTMAKLGVDSFNPSPFTTFGLRYKAESDYVVRAEIADFSYRSVTIQRIPQ